MLWSEYRYSLPDQEAIVAPNPVVHQVAYPPDADQETMRMTLVSNVLLSNNAMAEEAATRRTIAVQRTAEKAAQTRNREQTNVIGRVFGMDLGRQTKL